MAQHLVLISVIAFVFTTVEGGSALVEEVILNLEQGNITGKVNPNDGQIEYLRVPLKLQRNTEILSTNSSSLENILNANTTEHGPFKCIFLEAETESDSCVSLNVYTTLINESHPRFPVKFYNLRENKHQPKYDPTLGVIVVTAEDNSMSTNNIADKENIAFEVSLEWIYRNIKRFGGDIENIHTAILPEEMPQLKEPQFVVGYELPESHQKNPIHLSDAKNFIAHGIENSSVISLILDEATALQDSENGNDESTTIYP